jgi:hypothetical protein
MYFFLYLRFGVWKHAGGWVYEDYNMWRKQEGLLCR